MIFVDTGAWFASAVPRSARYEAARSWTGENAIALVTSDYVIDETLTLLRARNEHEQALAFGKQIFAGELCVVEHVTRDDINAAWQVFTKFSDKGWSFTDCTSKVIMERLGIKMAFAFDQHFRQFGSVDVVP